ncbi:MAG: Fervidolysin [Bacteroidetes bacterium]|nr:MAG: Fervidolysin [Bacteroidota bacterium]
MNRRIFLSIVIIFLSLFLWAQDFLPPANHSWELNYKKDEILVKFKDDVDVNITVKDSRAATGITEVDMILWKAQALNMEQVFRGASKQVNRNMNHFPGGSEKPVPQLFNIYLVKTTGDQDIKVIIAQLNALKEVEYAEVNGEMYLADFIEENSAGTINMGMQSKKKGTTRSIPTVDDPLFPNQWGIPEIKADSLWETTTGDTTIVVAVLDTGVDWTHPDLDDNIWTNKDEIPNNGIDDDGNGYIDDVRGWDFINNDNNPMDDHSHGTHCAGILGAEANNGIGIAGVAWKVRIMPVKVMQSGGGGSYAQISQGVWYAAENDAQIYSMSIGGYFESTTLRLALEYAYSTGIIVAAAGNDGYKIDEPTPPFPLTNPLFPAAYGWVLGVEATAPGRNNAWFSNYDPTGPVIHDSRPYDWIFYNYAGYNYEMRAPGVGIWSTVPNGGYRSYSGTSMATPLVAGAIALMKSYNNSYTNEEIFAKLIQPNKINLFQAGVLDIQKSTFIYPDPDLYFEKVIYSDTTFGDGDGRPDAGEHIEMYVRALNAGGTSDTTWGKLVFGEFEDTTTVNIISDSCYFGSLSTYSSLTSSTPFEIQIDENVVDGRNIRMDVLLIQRVSGINDTSIRTINLDVEHGLEIRGVHNYLHLTPDFYYIVTEPAVINTLIIDPGVTINFKNNTYLVILNKIYAVGTPDSMITFKAADASYLWKGISHSNTDNIYDYCVFRDGYNDYTVPFITGNAYTITNSVFKENYANLFRSASVGQNISKNVFVENKYNPYGNFQLIDFFGSGDFKNNVVVNNTTYRLGAAIPGCALQMNAGTYYTWDNCVAGNAIFNNHDFTEPYGVMSYDIGIAGSMNIYNINSNYHGSTDSTKIHSYFQDFFVESMRPVLRPNNILAVPPSEAHGFVWKVLINGVDAQASNIEPLGAGLQRVDVIFNRAMNTAIEPFVTYGVRFPYTQNAINDSKSWSADGTQWTGYFNINTYQSDGENTIRVAYAQDDENFEIPIERDRFKFRIQATGSQTINFIATPGIGKVDLEWPMSDSTDVFGYNIYRYLMTADGTFSDTTLITENPILDSLTTDFGVVPNTTYYYMFTMVYTDLSESDYSKVVSATPFSAANGDANGDMTVNVLDITTIVSYILNHNPQPFLNDAADVNYDGQINLLDIIGVVNIIMGGNKSIFISQPATVFFDTQKAEIESDGSLSGLQFQLVGKNIEELQLKNLPIGFEIIRMISGDTLTIMMFNMQNNTLPEGRIKLFDIARNPGTLDWGEVFGGNYAGRYVPVFKSGNAVAEDYRYGFNVYPNPAKDYFQTDIRLPGKSTVIIKLYDSFGRSTNLLEKAVTESGRHNFRFDKQLLPAARGLYILQIQISPLDKNTLPFRKEVKLLLK